MIQVFPIFYKPFFRTNNLLLDRIARVNVQKYFFVYRATFMLT